MGKKENTPAQNEPAPEIDTTRDRFLAAAERRQKILDVINATQHAKATLYQTRQDMFRIGDEQGEQAEMARKMEATAEREKKEWMKLKGSKLKKLFKGAQYETELKKEEDEYYEAYEWQLRAEAAANELAKQSIALRDKKDLLLKQVEEHRQAQVQLLDLYEEIFDGPTPTYPEEDEMEAEFNAIQKVCETLPSNFARSNGHRLSTWCNPKSPIRIMCARSLAQPAAPSTPPSTSPKATSARHWTTLAA